MRTSFATILSSCIVTFGLGCGKSGSHDHDKIDIKEIEAEESVEFAQKNSAELDQKLASSDPGSVAGLCAVMKNDVPKIAKTDAALADSITKRCGHDRAIREFVVGVDKAEAARKDKPTGHVFECTTAESELKTLAKEGFDGEAAVTAAIPRLHAACPE